MFFFSCTRNDPAPPVPPPATDKTITAFAFAKADNSFLAADITATINGDSIKCFLPTGTSLTNLAPTVTFKGKAISPASKTPADFSGPVTYTVTAEDNTTKKYTVLAKAMISDQKNITSFVFKKSDNSFLQQDITGIISHDSVFVSLPYQSPLTNLIPTITIDGTGILPATGSPQDFTNEIHYTVTAADGSTKVYSIFASVQSLSATLYINSSYTGSFGFGFGRLYAVDVNTGNVKWNYDYQRPEGPLGLTFNIGVLYTATGPDLFAFDTASKAFLWSYTTGGYIYATPTLDNGVLYVNGGDLVFYAIDAANGSLKWSIVEGDPSLYPGSGNYSAATIRDGIVYFASLTGYIYAVEAATGLVKWKVLNTYGSNTSIQSSPSVVNGILYITDDYHNLIALDINDGSYKWVYIANSIAFGSPTIENGVAYFTSADSYLYALDAVTGVLKWKFKADYEIQASPIISGGLIYFGESGSNFRRFYAVNIETGLLSWSYTNDYGFTASPVVYGGVVYAPSNYELLALDAATGILRWTLPTGKEEMVDAPLIVDINGNIYHSTISGSKD